MAPGDKSGKVVFIGNIPYGLTEEQIVHTFSTAGQVLNFRLVYDKETGRPKGFGFAEFSDADAAASAVRNLNDYEIMGRKLRVDYSNDGGAGDSAPAGYTSQNQQQGPNGQDTAPQARQSGLPALPPGADVPPNLSAPDAISRTISAVPAPQLLDILSQMRGLATSDPVKATALLSTAPQLSYAIFQSLLLLGLVDQSMLVSIVEHSRQQQVQQQAPPPPSLQQPPYQQFPPQYLQQSNVPTPPIQSNPYQAPQQAQPPVDQRAELLRQVLAMTPQQLDAMPPAERQQLIAIRQSLMSGQTF